MKAKQTTIPILDNGHGKDTKGKRSPVWADGTQLFEWEFNRDIVRRVAEHLERNNYQYRILVPEIIDISLGERCRRANRIWKETNHSCMLVSIHANAGGGTGWEAYTTKGQTRSDRMAEIFYGEFAKVFPEKKMRKDTADGDSDKEEQFYILKNTVCPAVLLENFFMDYEPDCRLIMSETGRDRVALAIFNALKKMIA